MSELGGSGAADLAEVRPAPPYDGDKPLADIEEDIAQTRADLTRTLDTIEQRLSPRHLLEKGADMVREAMDGNLGRAGEAVRANPVPLALIGAGIGWLVLAQILAPERLDQTGRGLRRPLRDGLRWAAGRADALTEDLLGKVKGVVGGIPGIGGAPASAAREDAYAYAREKTGGDAADRAAGASAGLSRTMREHPLVLGGLALLAGAVAAMLLPRAAAAGNAPGAARAQLFEEVEESGRHAHDPSGEAIAPARD